MGRTIVSMDVRRSSLVSIYAQAFQGLPKPIWLLSFVMLINRSGSMVLTFASLYVHTELGYSQEWAALLVVAWGIGSSLGNLLGGYLTDRFGPIPVQVGSLWGSAVAYGVLSQMTSYWSFGIMLGIASMISDIFRPANGVSLTSYAASEHHGRAFALNRLAINLGLTVGPALGGFLASFSYQWIFWIDAVTSLMAGLMMFIWFSPISKPFVRAARVGEGESKASPWRDLPYLKFLGLTFLTYTIFFQLLSTYTLFLKDDYGLGEMSIGLLLAMNTLIVVAVEMVLVHQLRHWNKIPLIAWGSFLMVEGFGMLALGHGVTFALVSILVWTVGEMLAMPQGLAFAAAYGPPSARARYLAAYSTCVALAFVSAPLLGAWCYSQNHYLIWQISLPVGFVVLIGTYFLRVQPPQKELAN